MKNYRAWIFVLFVVAIMVASSAILPEYSEANRAPISVDEAEAIDATSSAQSQSSASSGEPVTDAYAGRLSLNVARRGHTLTALNDGRVAIIGGQNEGGLVSEVEVLDTQLQSIKVATGLRVARSRHTATVLADGSLLVAGGWNQKNKFNSTEIFNPRTNSVSRGPRLRQPRAAHAATVLQDGRILFTGGSADASAEIFDPKTNRSTLLKSKMTAARSFHEAVLLADGNVLIVGGIDPNGERLRSAEVFDTIALSFSATLEPMKIKRAKATLRVLPDGKVQVIGGDYDATMEIYDPALNRFNAAAHLTPTANIFSTAKVLRSATRAALIDSHVALEGSFAINEPKPLQHFSVASKNALDNFDELLERADYSSAEVAGMNRSVIAGGVGRSGEHVRSVVLMESSTAAITTDKTEYLPGDQPVISGSGFEPNEAITIVRQEARPGHKRRYIEVVADERGNFINRDLSPADFQQGVTYTLTAMGGQSSDVAQTAYGDVQLEKPKKEDIKFDMPVLFRDASFEHEKGILVWDVQSPVRKTAKPPEFTIMATSATNTFNFSTIIDQPCLGIGSCPLPSGIDIQMKTGSSLTLESNIGFSSGQLQIEEKLYGQIILDIIGTGDDIDLPSFGIPGASVGFMINLGDVVDISLSIGIVVKPSLTLDGTIRTTLGLGTSSSPGQSITIKIPDSSPVTGNLTPTVDFDIVSSTIGGCLKIAIGPEIELSGGVGPEECEFGASGSIFTGPYVKGCFNVSNPTTCPTFAIPVYVGLNAEVAAAIKLCVELGTSYSADLFETLITTFTGNLGDATPPMISCPLNITQNNDPGECGADVSFTPTASDGACPAPTISCTPSSGSFFAKGTTTVTCTATDGGGNMSQPCSFTVTVNDVEDPTIACPMSITNSNDPGQCGKTVSYSVPSGSDNCAVQSVSCSPNTGTFFSKGTTTVTCTVVDTSGNDNTCNFTVTINDTEPPTITCPNPIIQGTDPNVCAAVVNFAPTAKDNCTLPKGAIVCSPPTGSSFPKGTTTVNCTVTDGAGLTANCSFSVTINDTQGPAFSCPANVVAGTTPGLCEGIANYTTPSATDNCDGPRPVMCSPASGLSFPKGVTTVTCSSSDLSSNTTTCMFTITINDTEPPKITCPANITALTALTCPPTIATAVSFAVPSLAAGTLSDNCPGASAVCVPPPGSIFPIGTTTVTCKATDEAGNMTTCSFTVKVFNACVQDDSNPGNVALINTITGEYRFCCNGTVIKEGFGLLLTQGCNYTIEHNTPDRRVSIKLAFNTRRGSASIQSPPGAIRCTITDRDITNNSCKCGS